MEWTKAVVETNNEDIEIVTAVLLGCGVTGMELIQPDEQARFLKEHTGAWDYADESLLQDENGETFVVFYASNDDAGVKQLLDVENELKVLSASKITSGSKLSRIEQSIPNDWAHEWKKHFKPIKIGKVVIVPEWESYTPSSDEAIVLIDPGSAFGTGQHQSTQLAIDALSKLAKQGDLILDIGCGSGILSITALQLGAESCFACDIDEYNAVYATGSNARLNKIDPTRLAIHAGDVLSNTELRHEISKQRFDIVVANIVADVVSELAPFAKSVLKQGGTYIATGIIDEKKAFVESKFLEAGLINLHIVELDGWVMIAGEADA